MNKIALAKRQLKDGTGDGWIETTEDLIKYFNPNGLGGAQYYIHDGIMICKYGDKEKCINNMELSAHERLHGTLDGIIETAGETKA